MNKNFLEERIQKYFNTKTEFADSLGIKLGSVTDWFTRGVIPAKRIPEVFEKLKIVSEEEIENALGMPKLEVCYRAKKDISESEVAEEVTSSIKKFSKVSLGLRGSEKASRQLLEIKEKIGESRDVLNVASIIRSYLDLTDRTPFNFGSVNYILEKYGVRGCFVPFDSFGFSSNEKLNPLAFSAKIKDQFLILCDSNRTFDEAFFDLTHELVHVFTGILSSKDAQTEKFVDGVSEELIYPKLFLEREYPFLLKEDNSRITEDDFLNNGFRKMIIAADYFMAPRGVAKRLANLGYLNDRLKVYDWMYYSEHEFYLKSYGRSITDLGKMKIDFSDSDQFEKFFVDTVLVDPLKYPIFYDLYLGLIENRVTARAFAELFNMDSGEADEMKLSLFKKRQYGAEVK